MDVDAAARVVAELDKEQRRRRAAGAAVQEREAQRAAAAQANVALVLLEITLCRRGYLHKDLRVVRIVPIL